MEWKKRLLAVLVLVAIPLCGRAGLECWHYRQAQLLRERGHDLEHADRVPEAIACYEQSLAHYPYFLDLRSELAELYESQDDLKSAEHYFDESIRWCPQVALSQSVVYRERGHFFLRHQQYDKARNDLQQSLRFDPTESLSQRLLDQCDRKQGRSSAGPQTKGPG